MRPLPKALQRLIRELSKLPSVGEKTAFRLAYHMTACDRELAGSLADALISINDKIARCLECGFLTEGGACAICSDSSRDFGLVCVVEKPIDVVAIERVGEFKGIYHVLNGLWAPLKGQGPDSLGLDNLLMRLERVKPREVILALGSTVEGDATALYIARLLSEVGINSTRLAQGLPKGGELEYADEITLSRAFSGRVAVNLR
ncbi:MAG TPA: recombination mediator RecR [Oligoflexia bacterium]|nr:recombination mediator RecR [Oligoflexia bacterium]HMP27395.1 recombination mediator RecR [Oligoflexia bacterium]